MAIPIWSAPYHFDLTNPLTGNLPMNRVVDGKFFALDQSQCGYAQAVRATVDHVPQANGDILHRRFLTGVQVTLGIQLWQAPNVPACDWVLKEMTDEAIGAFRSLLNAGDNAGRLAWEVPLDDVPNLEDRMLDDVRLLVYPRHVVTDTVDMIVVTIDSQYPYAQTLEQTLTPCEDGVPVTLTNDGTAEYDPVFQVNRLNGVTSSSVVHNFTITVQELVGTTPVGDPVQFVYDDSLPGAVPISAGGHYAEIVTFANTIYLDGDSTNLKAGVDELNSEYPSFPVNSFQVQIDGCDMDVLWAPAWG